MCVAGTKITTIDFSRAEYPAKKPPLPRSFKPSRLGNRMSLKHIASMPNAHVRKCPESAKAVTRIDPRSFSAPLGSTSKPTNIPDGHLDMYLKKVEAFNNTLLCSYATRAGNAKTTVEFSCKDARPSNKDKHAYYRQ